VGQRLGQHFLVKGSILERIAAAACPDHVELVVEIGPGRGALTEKLLPRASRVIAIELDPDLVEHLRARFDQRLEVIHQDVLAADFAHWPGAPIVGNLPYYITSPILEKVVRMKYSRAVFLMQKEVAERLTAAPGSRDYGFLTVQTAVYARARLLFGVKPSAFHPPPKVDSAVVLLEPRPPAVADPEGFVAFAGACFRQKRKTLRNNLAGLYGKDAVDTLPEAGLRAEQLPLEQLVDVFERLRRPLATELRHPEA
jgi:16S rRNA (adenine1518-N6/adenine1519-N6)-dimethyltransferase